MEAETARAKVGDPGETFHTRVLRMSNMRSLWSDKSRITGGYIAGLEILWRKRRLSTGDIPAYSVKLLSTIPAFMLRLRSYDNWRNYIWIVALQ